MNYRIVHVFVTLASVSGLVAWTSAPEKKVDVVAPARTESRAVSKTENNLTKDNLVALTSETQFNELINSGKIVVVDFHATWCGPCKNFGPIFKQVAKEFPDMMFVTVDVDQMKAVTSKQGVRRMPTILSYKNGKRISEFDNESRTASTFRKYVEALRA